MHNMVWEVAVNAGFWMAKQRDDTGSTESEVKQWQYDYISDGGLRVPTHALADKEGYTLEKSKMWRTWRVATKCKSALDLLQMLLEDHLGIADHE